jgi:SnoaL-like domain
MNDLHFLNGFADRWQDAWNSHDTEQVLALAHPEIEWDDRTFWPSVLHGREELRQYTDAIWRAMPDVRFEEIERFFSPDAQRGVFLFRQFGSAPETLGRGRFDSHGCDIFLEFRGGLLSRYLAAYDIARMLEQMQALPPREGRLGGAYLLSLTRTRV